MASTIQETPPATSPIPRKASIGARAASTLANRRLREVLVLAPLLALIFEWPFLVATDPDYWWHVRTGQLIVETGSIPRTDPYSYTAFGHAWVAHEWLTEVLLYLTAVRFGYVGNVILFGLVGVITGVLVYATCRRRGMGEIGAALFMLWSQAMGIASNNVRPQMLTTLLLAACALLLTMYLEGKTRALWPFPLLFALWVNLHGGYIIGLVLLGLTIIGLILPPWRRASSQSPRPLVVFTALSVLATLLNPHGFEAWLYPLTYFRAGNASQLHVAEWQSPNFHQPLFLLFGAGLLCLMLLGVARRPLGPVEACWTLVFAALGLESIRHVPLFGVVGTPLLAARVQSALPIFRRSISAWQRPLLLVAASAALVVVALGTVLSPTRRATLQLGWEPSAAKYPSGAVTYLQNQHLEGNIFNEYGWGGYLIYHLYPAQRVFIDGRADVYGDAFGAEYDEVVALGPKWRDILARYDVRLVLVPRASRLAMALGTDMDWHLDYSDQVAVLFVRET